MGDRERLAQIEAIGADIVALSEHGPRFAVSPTEWPAWLAIGSAVCGGFAGLAGLSPVAALLVGFGAGLHLAHGRAVHRYIAAFRRENGANQRRIDDLTGGSRG